MNIALASPRFLAKIGAIVARLSTCLVYIGAVHSARGLKADAGGIRTKRSRFAGYQGSVDRPGSVVLPEGGTKLACNMVLVRVALSCTRSAPGSVGPMTRWPPRFIGHSGFLVIQRPRSHGPQNKLIKFPYPAVPHLPPSTLLLRPDTTRSTTPICPWQYFDCSGAGKRTTTSGTLPQGPK